MKKLTIDTVEEILAELWEASKYPSVSKDYRIELQLRMGHFLNANTEESNWKPMDIEKDINRLEE